MVWQRAKVIVLQLYLMSPRDVAVRHGDANTVVKIILKSINKIKSNHCQCCGGGYCAVFLQHSDLWHIFGDTLEV